MPRRLPRPHLSRSKAVNAFLALAVAIVIGLSVWTVRADDEEGATESTTVTVDVGAVTASVSASGNIESGDTIDVAFEGSGGVVTQILVEEGERVRRGQRIAVVDQTSARQGLQTAQSTLRSAQAGYTTATQGSTTEERAADQANINVSEASVRSAEVSLRSARQTYGMQKRQQDAAVSAAESTVRSSEERLEAAMWDQQDDPSAENREALAQARADLSTARTALTSARNTRTSSLLQARQQVASAASSVRSARQQLASTRAQTRVNQQPARPGTVEAALAQIDSAEVTVAQARTALEQTVLRAPVSGKIQTVNGTVGETSSSAGSSTSSSTESTTGSTDSTSSSGSGFATMSAANVLVVTSYVAEADIAAVRVGQSAAVTLSASGEEVGATVTSIDTVETVTNNVVEYGVTVRLEKTTGVKLGQSSQVVITTGSKQDVTRVSSSALTTIGQRTTVTVQDGGDTNEVVVETGLEGDTETEILSGLEAGDVVVLPEQAGGGGDFTFPGGGIGGGL